MQFPRTIGPAAPALAALFLAAALSSCNSQRNDSERTPLSTSIRATGAATVTQAPFGAVDGKPVTRFTVRNYHGMTAEIINYGATVTRLLVPDREGDPGDVVLGFDSLAGYLAPDNPYFGCIVGRYANRIAGAKFELDGKPYQLAANNNGNSLHGGLKGFDKQVWDAALLPTEDGVKFTLVSPDGDEGYPGTLRAEVTYTLTADNSLLIEYSATADRPTPVNLTHHGYFNLSAGKDSTILAHRLTIRAGRYTAVNDLLIPTGELPAVTGTPMDFTSPFAIGERIASVPGGYDHNWALDSAGMMMSPAAKLYDPSSGRVMEVYTTEPGIQFYAGNFLDGTLRGKGGKPYPKHAGLCLEAQHFPDSPHQPSFPNTIVRPGETYRQTTIYKFTAR
jgi:aldose 1-epimerase